LNSYFQVPDAQDIARQGLTLEKYLQLIKKSQQALEKDLEPQAIKNIKIGLALGEVARKEGINSQGEDVAKKAIQKLIKIAT